MIAGLLIPRPGRAQHPPHAPTTATHPTRNRPTRATASRPALP